MKRIFVICLLSILVGIHPSAAQDPGVGLPESTSSLPQTEKQVLRASDIIGQNVFSTEGAVLGSIEDLVLAGTGSVVYLVVKMDERLLPIPIESFGQGAGGGDSPQFILNAARPLIANAPSFSEEEWRALRQNEWIERVRAYFAAADRNPIDRNARPQAPRRLRIVE